MRGKKEKLLIKDIFHTKLRNKSYIDVDNNKFRHI